MIKLSPWLTNILADPITKQPVQPDHFPLTNGVMDARVFLKNTHGYDGWAEGQNEYESFGLGDQTDTDGYRREIAYDIPIYEHFTLRGRILDCGGGRAQCVNSCRRAWSSFPLILGWKPRLPPVGSEKKRIPA